MSPETQIDVKQEAPSTSTEVVNEAETTAAETTATQEQTSDTQADGQETTQTTMGSPQVPINADLYDERGVPWKNRAMEFERKFQETQMNLPKQIAEEVAKLAQPAQRKYTIAELEQFAQENPSHRGWVEEEKAKILKADLAQEFDRKIEATTKAQRDEMVKNQTFQQVVSQFPELAVRDQQGNFLSWNNMNPMTQMVGRYMSNPEIANRPDGLMIASKLAYADQMMAQNPKTAKTIQGLKSQVRRAQANGMVEGGGKKPAVENPQRKLIDRVRETGKSDDAKSVMFNILKAQGQIRE